MKSAIAAVLCIVLCVVSAIRTSGQTPRTYEIIDEGGPPPIPTVHSEIPNTLTTVVVTWNYYPQPKMLVLHLTNISGKDITAYNLTVRNKYADGTQDDPCCGVQSSSELLGGLIAAQMAKGTSFEESAERGNNIFAAGTTRDQTVPEPKDITGVDAVVDVAVYADGTKDVANDDALKRIWAGRQRQLLALQKVNQIIQNALADPTEHPTAAALTELANYSAQMTKYTMEQIGQAQSMYDFQQGQEMYLQNGIQTLRSMQQPQGKTTVRERLKGYAERLEREIELMSPHCALVTITLIQ
jgi:hypothetical protein